MSTKPKLILAALAAAVLAGCAASNPNNVSVYSSNSVGQTAQGQRINVMAIEPIKIESPQDRGFAQVAAAGGASILCGAIGNTIGEGGTRQVATALGVVGCGAAAAKVASVKQLRDGYRIGYSYVRDGRKFEDSITVYANGPVPRVGAEAMLYRGANVVDNRVTPL
jgi:outer membrane lipoprotein SlyB